MKHIMLKSGIAMVALSVAVSAQAADASTAAGDAARDAVPHYTAEETKEVWQNTKEATGNAWEKTKETARDAWDGTKEMTHDAIEGAKDYKDDWFEGSKATQGGTSFGEASALSHEIRQVVNERHEAKKDMPYTIIPAEQKATYWLDKKVLDAHGKTAASIYDVILSSRGDIETFVLARGGFVGLGTSLVAIDADNVGVDSQGNISVPVTKADLKNLVGFSYDVNDAAVNMMTLRADMLSVKQMLKGKLIGADGQGIAAIDNVVIQNNSAKGVVVSFGNTFGIGGYRAMLPLDNVSVRLDGARHNLALTASDTEAFKQFEGLLSKR